MIFAKQKHKFSNSLILDKNLDYREEDAVQFFAVAEAAVDEAYGIDLGAHADFIIRCTEDVLYEYPLDAFFLHTDAHHVLIATAKGGLELYGDACHNGIGASLMKVHKAHAVAEQKFMTGMLQIVLVVGVVHDALHVAFVVAHFVAMFVDIV